MRPGEIIQGQKDRYTLLRPLGTPGLYGRAFLCRGFVDEQRYVVKALNPGAPSDGVEVLEREARNLERVAASEDAVGQRYAVRLIDRSSADSGNHFIVMEQATGENVLTEIVERVQNWDTQGLDEKEALLIAQQFARALSCVHSAGLLYDDMKLDNLFWANPTLRIIDWNVLSELSERGSDGLAGDWARFGARLYELRTGQRIGLDRQGRLIGVGPSGPRWENMVDGVRDIISRALSLGYRDDRDIAADLQRELDLLEWERAGDWVRLLQLADTAAGERTGSPVHILAPLARAERLIATLDGEGRAEAEQRCTQLRQDAEAYQGRAADSEINNAFRLLRSGNGSLAISRFQEAYRQAGERDPRPRRGLWLAQLASDHPDRYAPTREDLEKAVEILNAPDTSLESLRSAKQRLTLAEASWGGVELFRRLCIEADLLANEQSEQLDAALESAELLCQQELSGRFRDLREKRDDLKKRILSEQRAAAAEDEHRKLIARRNETLAEAQRAELKGEIAEALEAYRRSARVELPDGDEMHRKWLHHRINSLGCQLELEELAKQAEGLSRESFEDAGTQFARIVRRACALAPEIGSLFKALESYGRDKTLDQQITQITTLLQEELGRQMNTLQDYVRMLHGGDETQSHLQDLLELTTKIDRSLDKLQVEVGKAQASSQDLPNPLEPIRPSVVMGDPDGVRRLIEWGSLIEAEKRIQEMNAGEDKNELEKMIKQRRNAASSYKNSIERHLKNGDFEQAARNIRVAIILDPESDKHFESIKQILEKIREEWKEFDNKIEAISKRPDENIWNGIARVVGSPQCQQFFSIIDDTKVRRPSARWERAELEALMHMQHIATCAAHLSTVAPGAEYNQALVNLHNALKKESSQQDLLPNIRNRLNEIVSII